MERGRKVDRRKFVKLAGLFIISQALASCSEAVRRPDDIKYQDDYPKPPVIDDPTRRAQEMDQYHWDFAVACTNGEVDPKICGELTSLDVLEIDKIIELVEGEMKGRPDGKELLEERFPEKVRRSTGLMFHMWSILNTMKAFDRQYIKVEDRKVQVVYEDDLPAEADERKKYEKACEFRIWSTDQPNLNGGVRAKAFPGLPFPLTPLREGYLKTYVFIPDLDNTPFPATAVNTILHEFIHAQGFYIRYVNEGKVKPTPEVEAREERMAEFYGNYMEHLFVKWGLKGEDTKRIFGISLPAVVGHIMNEDEFDYQSSVWEYLLKTRKKYCNSSDEPRWTGEFAPSSKEYHLIKIVIDRGWCKPDFFAGFPM
jgi:hypothetical protein